MREITLNTLKIGNESDNKNRKLEIPIELVNKSDKDSNKAYNYKVINQMKNSNVQIEYNYQNSI